MNWLKNIYKIFTNRQRVFIVDEDIVELGKSLKTVKSFNVIVDGFSDYQTLLYSLQSQYIKKYKVGIIHECESKYEPQALSHFITNIDPSIKIIIYKDKEQLKEKTQNLSLTY